MRLRYGRRPSRTGPPGVPGGPLRWGDTQPDGGVPPEPARPVARRAVAVAASVLLVGGSVLAWVVAMGDGRAAAHGSMQNPPSRIYLCWQEGPEAPRSAACRALRDAGGSQALYDWNGVLVPDVAGRHREVIPDGKLCSAGNDAFRGLDLARDDWPTTSLPSGGGYQFRWRGTAPHVGAFEFYVTRDGYQPTRPLTWADLEPEPFLRADRPPLEGGSFRIDGHLPAKQGRHLIYTIYQRSDSPEAFYACSDVDFGGAGAPAPREHPEETGSPDPGPPLVPEHHHPAPHPHEHHPAPHPRRPAPGAAADWAAGVAYPAGAQVTYQGGAYVAVQGHTAQPGWEPPAVPALWHAVPEAGADGVPDWRPQTPYATGAHVTYQGVVYMCRQGHVALAGWEPPQTPALWEPMG
ncbi:lytic polysaccharide monooxygenase [Micromonospora fluostatini]|uniref:lytic polysaccharide monooxygenase n=1 Tax=Micromonospora sp. JCM 30529 TaxID=3421643 RepID=UPI003D17EBFF